MKPSIACCLAVVVVAAIGCGTKKEKPFEGRHTVGRVDLRDVITQTGEVQPVVKVELKSEASGRIDTVYVREGQGVRTGDTIIVIDPSRLRFKKQRIDLAVNKARIELEIAKRDLDNAKELIHTGTVSQRSLVDIQSRYDLLDIAYRQQLLDLKDVMDELSKTVVTSPMDGVLTSLDVEAGEIAVSATTGFSGGTAIATIADISRLEVVSQIGEVDYVHIEPGQKVVVRPEAVEGAQTTGTIDFVALSAKKEQNEELGTFEVRIALDSIIAGITAGINVNVEFVILEKKGVLGVPAQYVQNREGKYSVMMAEAQGPREGKVRPRPIQVGATDYRNYEVLSGLKEGDVILFRERPAGGPPGQGRAQGGRGGP